MSYGLSLGRTPLQTLVLVRFCNSFGRCVFGHRGLHTIARCEVHVALNEQTRLGGFRLQFIRSKEQAHLVLILAARRSFLRCGAEVAAWLLKVCHVLVQHVCVNTQAKRALVALRCVL
jgi:hypothetical protein